MNAKIWIPLTAATITGAAAAWAGYQLVREPALVQGPPQVLLESVVVAARDLPAGTRLNKQDLGVLRVEQGSMRIAAIREPADLVGRVVAEAVSAGQPLNSSLLATEGTVPGLSATLPVGYRAITLQVDPFNGLDGFLYPEAHVDVIAAVGSGENTAARTIAQDVRVLAVAGRLKGESIEKTGEERASLASSFSVTLMVTPQQAAAIELAADSGSPRLMLRPGEDREIHPFEGMTLAELRGDRTDGPLVNQGSPWDADPIPVTSIDPPPVVTVTTVRDPVEPSDSPEPTKTAVDPTQPQARPVPQMHVIEVIRGGVTSRIALPLHTGSEPKARPARERAIANTDTSPAAQ